MRPFWIIQACIAIAGVAGLIAFNGACGITCDDYVAGDSDTCADECARVADSDGNICPDSSPSSPYAALHACAMSSCALFCHKFLACADYGAGADDGCNACLAAECSRAWKECLAN